MTVQAYRRQAGVATCYFGYLGSQREPKGERSFVGQKMFAMLPMYCAHLNFKVCEIGDGFFRKCWISYGPDEGRPAILEHIGV